MQSDTDILAIFTADVIDRTKLDAVMTTLVDRVQANEPGTISYEWMLSEDEERLVVYERYRDSDALMTHLGGFSALLGDVTAAVKPVSLEYFGDVSDAVKSAVADWQPRYHKKIAGFAR